MKHKLIAVAVAVLACVTYYQTQVNTYPNCKLEAAKMPTKIGVKTAYYACRDKFNIKG